ncbi:galactose-1-phosphate uridylyltransferase [Candidatus Woesearchaeota archaeon]|nr:MAG: galactose-1-phosphate uridylyltransferase [Candidatus Woesearchaeota archaeon]
MGELRKDYVLDRWVIVDSNRATRPHEFDKEHKAGHNGKCFFCPGNESSTPPEIGRIPKNGSWQIRWFENKFPATTTKARAFIDTHNRFYTFSQAYGHHEVIVETPRHDRQLWDLSVDDIEKVLQVYARRIVALEKDSRIKYVCVFKNHGAQAGTSIVHSHSQLIALQMIPREIRDILQAMRRFVNCPYCSIVASESKSDRRCFENDKFSAFTPYASQFNYEVVIFPKSHVSRLEDVDLRSLSDILSLILRRVRAGGFDYNLIVNYGPQGSDFHFHIRVCPRIALWGGFEIGSGVVINTVAPEDAAAFYRGE